MDLQLRLCVAHGRQCGDGDDLPFLQRENAAGVDIAEGEFDGVAGEISASSRSFKLPPKPNGLGYEAEAPKCLLSAAIETPARELDVGDPFALGGFENVSNERAPYAPTLVVRTDADLIDLEPATCVGEQVLFPLMQEHGCVPHRGDAFLGNPDAYRRILKKAAKPGRYFVTRRGPEEQGWFVTWNS